MEALTALVAALLGRLHGVTADAVCPGGWPWAVSLLGVAVGLVPAAGAAAVALWRRRIGSRYGPAESVVLAGRGCWPAGSCRCWCSWPRAGCSPAAAGSGRVPGLTARQLRDLDSAVCLVGAQSSYLGRGSVAAAFTAAGPVRAGLAVLALAGLPAVVALFTAASARLALRRGPRWPARFFWLPVLAVAVLTTDVPAGSAAHLWLGASAGALLGMPAVLALGAPGWAVVHRSLAARPAGARRRGAATRRPRPSTRSRAAAPPRPGAGGADRPGGFKERLASRFAARAPEPVVTARADPAPRPPLAGGAPRPTLVAPAGVPGGPIGGPGAAAARRGPGRRAPARPGSGWCAGSGRAVSGGVWLAHDARLGHTVALKAAHVRDAETEERIRREARALATVRHPHCVQIHDLVPADSDPGLAELDGMVIVMEYVRGESLGELVRTRGHAGRHRRGPACGRASRGRWTPRTSSGVLHRDVKPGNIVFDGDGQAHLIDFGIARRTGDATLTATGFVLGTPDFLPPEVAAGGPGDPVGRLLAAGGDHRFRAVRAAAAGRSRGRGVGPAWRRRWAARPRTCRAARRTWRCCGRRWTTTRPGGRRCGRCTGRWTDWLRSVGARPDGPVTAGR